MFQASLHPSSGEEDCVLPHMVFCTGCASRGRVELGLKLCALCESFSTQQQLPHSAHSLRPSSTLQFCSSILRIIIF